MKRGGYLKRKTPLRASRKPIARRKAQKRPKTRAPKITALKKKLWVLCREITRKRYGNTCYTCGRKGLEGGNWQTGHFVTSSVCSAAMRYAIENLRPQCYHCNIDLSGNWPAYEKALRKELDHDYPDFLKRKNEETKGQQFDSLWYLAKIEEYEEILQSL